MPILLVTFNFLGDILLELTGHSKLSDILAVAGDDMWTNLAKRYLPGLMEAGWSGANSGIVQMKCLASNHGRGNAWAPTVGSKESEN